MTPWGSYLKQLLKDRKLSQAAFARLADVAPEFLSRAMRGVPQYVNGPATRPPSGRLDDWVKKLGLSPAERARFLELAELEDSPERVAAAYRDLKARGAWLEKEHAAMQQELEVLRRQFAALKKKIEAE